MKSRLRYKGLLLDHDDTVVNSTASIHYPAYLEIVGKMRPGHRLLSLEQWFELNFKPEGIMDFFQKELGFSREELQWEYQMWRKYTEKKAAPFFPQLPPILRKYTNAGGKLAVISLSDKDRIVRDYTMAGLEPPSVIFGWDMDKNRRKPAPWPALQALQSLKMSKNDVLMLDDALSGKIMAEKCGISFAASAWAHNIRTIHIKLQESSDFFFKNANDFHQFLFYDD